MVGIYKITNQINGKCYIGQSTNIEKRWKKHKDASFNPKQECYDYPLCRAFRKYGLENFSFEVIEECKKENLNEREIFYISKYNSHGQGGYNQDDGGFARHYSKLTESRVLEIIYRLKTSRDSYHVIGQEFGVVGKTIQDINLGNNWVQDDETYPIRPFHRRKIHYCEKCGGVIAHNSKRFCLHCSRETYRKVVNKPSPLEIGRMVKQMGVTGAAKNFGVDWNVVAKWCRSYGIPCHKKELIEWYNSQMNIVEIPKVSPKKNGASNNKRAVYQIDIFNNKIIAAFDSITEAATKVGIKSSGHITSACKGKAKSAGGFKWKYVDEYDFKSFSYEACLSSSRIMNGYKKPVCQINPITNEIIETFESTNAAAKAFGRKRGTAISNACGKNNKTAYGFKWCFVEGTPSQYKQV